MQQLNVRPCSQTPFGNALVWATLLPEPHPARYTRPPPPQWSTPPVPRAWQWEKKMGLSLRSCTRKCVPKCNLGTSNPLGADAACMGKATGQLLRRAPWAPNRYSDWEHNTPRARLRCSRASVKRVTGRPVPALHRSAATTAGRFTEASLQQPGASQERRHNNRAEAAETTPAR